MPEYSDYALIQILHCDRMSHIEGVLILGPDGCSLHCCELTQSLHYTLILEKKDSISVLLEARKGEAAVIVL